VSERTIGRRDALRITAVAGVSAAFGGSLVWGVLRQAGLHRVSETRTRMGTVVTITVVHPELEEARQMVAASLEEMQRLEDVLSRHRSDTPMGRLNAAGRLAVPPPELVELLVASAEYARLSDGAFDVTVAPLLDLYESSFRLRGGPPTDPEVDAALELVDFRAVQVDDQVISFDDARMSVTLDGIAKGYIVDRTIDVLVARGSERVMVNAGGDMATGGPGSATDPWTIGIQDPHVANDYVGLARLGGECIATSGDYMRSFTEDRRHHHIIDPRTGRSPIHTSSVSIVTGSAMDADALSTAVLVLGPEAGVALIDRISGAEGVIVTKGGDRVRSSGLGRHLA